MGMEQLIGAILQPPPMDIEEMAKEVICEIQRITQDKDTPLERRILIMREKLATGELAGARNKDKIKELQRHEVIGQMCLTEVRSALAKLEAEQADGAKEATN